MCSQRVPGSHNLLTVWTLLGEPRKVNLSMSGYSGLVLVGLGAIFTLLSLGHGSSGQMDSEILFSQGVAGGAKMKPKNAILIG